MTDARAAASGDLLAAIGGPAATSDVVVEATDVEKWFGRLQVLKGVSMTVKHREVVCVIESLAPPVEPGSVVLGQQRAVGYELSL